MWALLPCIDLRKWRQGLRVRPSVHFRKVSWVWSKIVFHSIPFTSVRPDPRLSRADSLEHPIWRKKILSHELMDILKSWIFWIHNRWVYRNHMNSNIQLSWFYFFTFHDEIIIFFWFSFSDFSNYDESFEWSSRILCKSIRIIRYHSDLYS